MYIDPALLSPVSALFGALLGGGASLLGAIYTQRSQDRVQRVASEIVKRETVYADFVMSASNLLLNAYTHDEISLSGDEQRPASSSGNSRKRHCPKASTPIRCWHSAWFAGKTWTTCTERQRELSPPAANPVMLIGRDDGWCPKTCSASGDYLKVRKRGHGPTFPPTLPEVSNGSGEEP